MLEGTWGHRAEEEGPVAEMELMRSDLSFFSRHPSQDSLSPHLGKA